LKEKEEKILKLIKLNSDIRNIGRETRGQILKCVSEKLKLIAAPIKGKSDLIDGAVYRELTAFNLYNINLQRKHKLSDESIDKLRIKRFKSNTVLGLIAEQIKFPVYKNIEALTDRISDIQSELTHQRTLKNDLEKTLKEMNTQTVDKCSHWQALPAINDYNALLSRAPGIISSHDDQVLVHEIPKIKKTLDMAKETEKTFQQISSHLMDKEKLVNGTLTINGTQQGKTLQ